ncbi:MAG: tyrosine-type recombinase/integrase [Clostridia bacterium]|nr:tyrosine-type recombinase/integrase [Clostridia bacterium]
MNTVSEKMINDYNNHLISNEKSSATIEKYIRDVRFFASWLGDIPLSKASLEYKKHLAGKYSPVSVNAAISSLNSFFEFIGRHDCRIRALKIQRKIFSHKDKELTKSEYTRLLNAAGNNTRLSLVMQTICACGIRVSELRYITAESAKIGQATIDCKGKMRVILIPKQLCKLLNKYAQKQGIKSGSIFVTKNGNPIDRSNIWSDMKKLCEKARVSRDKVFPHNLRHLFARTYYAVKKDIVRLADILGHSSINTTRIYTMETV